MRLYIELYIYIHTHIVYVHIYKRKDIDQSEV